MELGEVLVVIEVSEAAEVAAEAAAAMAILRPCNEVGTGNPKG